MAPHLRTSRSTGHRETWPVRSIRLRSWLRRKHYEATGAAATAGAISSALELLVARAQFDAPQRAVYLRVAVDAESLGLRALPEVRLEQLPRMADFALWATGCERYSSEVAF